MRTFDKGSFDKDSYTVSMTSLSNKTKFVQNVSYISQCLLEIERNFVLCFAGYISIFHHKNRNKLRVIPLENSNLFHIFM